MCRLLGNLITSEHNDFPPDYGDQWISHISKPSLKGQGKVFGLFPHKEKITSISCTGVRFSKSACWLAMTNKNGCIRVCMWIPKVLMDINSSSVSMKSQRKTRDCNLWGNKHQKVHAKPGK